MTAKMREFKEKIKKNRNKVSIDDISDIGSEKAKECTRFFDALADILKGSYEIVASCNKDFSRYLVPKGTRDQITYMGKPEKSFRISDHWSWYSSIKKCPDPDYIQCESVDMPKVRAREKEGNASNAWRGFQVAIQGTDGRYHHVFGDKWDPKTKSFDWKTSEPMDICRMLGLI